MLNLVDIGNTSVTCAQYHGGRLYGFSSINYNAIPKFVKKSYKSGTKKSINYYIVSSVVPKLTKIFKNEVNHLKSAQCLIVGKDIPLQINHKYHNYNKLGSDRKLNIYGSLRMYHAPLLIIDFGTAVTVDYISKKGVFEGGQIIPGPQISFQALIQKASQLPATLRLPKKGPGLIGKSTYDCIKAGVLQGYGAMVDELIQRFKSRYGRGLRTVLTGGYSAHLRPYIRNSDIYNPKLSVQSLLLLYKDWSAKRS